MERNVLIDFIRTEAPEFAASLQGAQVAQVELAERLAGVRLPLTYRDFVLTMGVDSGGLSLFGASENQDFNRLVKRLPPRTYPADRYFKIAFADDPSDISPPDYFLDLARGDAVDAPIVAFEDIGQFVPDMVNDVGMTFGEQLTDRVFSFLLIDPAPEQFSVVIGNLSREQGSASKRAAMTALNDMGFSRALPELPRVACFRRARLAVVLNVQVEGLSIALNFGGFDPQEREVVLDQLQLRFPSAALNRFRPPDFE
jgi:hypothetical protein